MDKNGNNYYLESIKNKINKLDLRKKQYEAELIQQNSFLEQNNSATQKLKFTKDILYDQYNSLLKLLEKQGIIFEITFSEYKPRQWENLFIVKTSKGYEIQTKTGSNLMMLDENFSRIIQDVNTRNSYSLIVMRVTGKVALVQLRFD
jgi:hypothetical protein